MAMMLRMMKIKKLKEMSVLFKIKIARKISDYLLFFLVFFVVSDQDFKQPCVHFCLCYLTL